MKGGVEQQGGPAKARGGERTRDKMTAPMVWVEFHDFNRSTRDLSNSVLIWGGQGDVLIDDRE